VYQVLLASAQQDIPRFRGGVDALPFTVTVLDKELAGAARARRSAGVLT
jgi:hypothetical protein